MGKSTDIQGHTDKYTLVGVLDPDTNEIKPVRMGASAADEILGMATQLHVWDTDNLKWVKMTQPTIDTDVIDVTATPDTSDLSTNNSTTSQLSADAVYTGTADDMLGYAQVAITLHSDVSSTDGGMQFQWSMDGTNWDDTYSFHLDHTVSTTRRFQFPVCARYFRVKYTNGSTGTADFRVQTILHRGNILTSIHSVGSDVVHDRSCQLVKSTIIGETTAGGGGYVNVKVSPSGALEMEVQEITDALVNYHFSGFETITTVDYLAYEDKDGNYYVQKIDNTAGTVTYAVGSGGDPGAGNYAGLSYGNFNTKF